ncbi:3-dehydroquinate synthase [Sulfobacillus harzensis]|uniref:3-dehydroquinate synthase n=1 Tax=Sulfobacillus harzensis TaxID=2729629 RepID=A0A7Y0L0Q4_9FIRM|nr:3-dehydroquinate synthase [Sulfobacillus harzensis]NMP21171.1 3-dehydroquinate synthase [Sulfobacillus harzensis]
MPEQEPIIKERREDSSRLIFGSDWDSLVKSVGPRRLVVADQQLAEWMPSVTDKAGADGYFSLPLGEAAKTLESVSVVYEWLAQQKAARDTVVVAVGGGVATDLIGFAAATYLRGLSWVAVSTTLLGQVDAAIGGKVGVNTRWGKNLVGAFHLPELVVLDPRFLASLPRREWQTGLGEIIKSALIAGGSLYDTVGSLPMPSADTLVEWQPVIRACAELKVSVVNQDPFEAGPRMFLNLGHTVGHALEALFGYGVLTHGEAVGLGTLVALSLSEELLGLDPGVRAEAAQWMERWELPQRLFAPVDFEALWEQLHRDKKARAGGLTWVLLESPGSPRLVKGIQRETVLNAVSTIL